MNENLENTLITISVIIGVWLFFSVCFITGTLSYKYECEDLKLVGLDTISKIRQGLFFVPYNYCSVKINDRYYSVGDYRNDEIIYNITTQAMQSNIKIKDNVIINSKLE